LLWIKSYLDLACLPFLAVVNLASNAEVCCMPYPSVEDLPPPVQAHLPPHAQEIYRSAFNNAWEEYAARGSEQREATAHRVAWAAVKRKYRKFGDRWIPRAGAD
jgi:cation transport regulator